MKRVLKVVSFVAGLGAVSWLLKDRLVPVPDPSRFEDPPAFKAAPAEPARAGDDLTALSGIGPRYSERLAELGITTYAALAAADAAELAEAIPGAGADQVRQWQEQARNLG